MMPIHVNPIMRHAVFLIDGSGSMEIAWNEAWSRLFDMLRSTDTAFSILLFKQPRYLTEAEEKGVIDTDERFYAVVDIAKVLREKNLVRIKRTPQPSEIGITFRGKTPLLVSILRTVELARSNYPKADINIYVVSDNRDSMVHLNGYDYSDADITVRKAELGVKVFLIPVGAFLSKYLSKYDGVLADEQASNSGRPPVLNLI